MTKSRLSFFLRLLLLAGTAVAQQPAPVAYFEWTAIKPGMEAQFEATLKRHWGTQILNR